MASRVRRVLGGLVVVGGLMLAVFVSSAAAGPVPPVQGVVGGGEFTCVVTDDT